MRPPGLPILTYHSLDDSGSVVSVDPALFARQMAHLHAEGYRTLRLAEAARRLRTASPLPDRCVVLTFDDGYRNVYTDAFPVLQRYGFTATVFLITRYCGGHNDWPGHASPVGRLPLMDWPQARELQRHGIELGAHTLTHPDLRRLDPATAEQEIAQSRAEIEDRLGTAVHTFAYPYGRYDAAVKALTATHFACACSTRLGRARPGDDPYALKRLDAYYFRREPLFTDVPVPVLDAYLFARQRLRDLRSRRG
ncbi:MAG: polysaccharide deacetylase family protein [Rhodothermales bacterium]|nr:polysaccharide deacetylase family protein [Rhodothermales bacterium]